MISSLFCLSLLSLSSFGVKALEYPKKIYGVNLGSWLLIEPWMLPGEWLAMGGQQCNDCSQCIASEFEIAKAYPDTIDKTMAKHWETWFTKDDVRTLKNAGINTVRIPMGFWIIEALVDRENEFFARGGLKHLRRGLKQLNEAGIMAILDHHALPGVQTPNQMFAGRCVGQAGVKFYTDYNYHRALIWTAVMTALSHLDPAFSNVLSIHAVNEIIMDSSLTPGYGDFQKNFVQVVRAVEASLGVRGSGHKAQFSASASANFTLAMDQVSINTSFNKEVRLVLKDALPIIIRLALELGLDSVFNLASLKSRRKAPIVTNFMDVSWQWGPARSNPADAANGPQDYDNHLYYNFGGVADHNEEAYMTHLCNLNRIESDAALGNSPLFFGEWSLATGFPGTDEFLKKWADAQKLQYGKDAGWIFWNFKIEVSPEAGDTARQWSYLEGLKRGYFTQDPTAFHDPHVCDAYVNTTSPA